MVSTAADALALLRDATFITADADRGAGLLLGTEVTLEQPRSSVVGATVVATAHGIYELALDGAPVSEDLFAPGWTSYEWRLQYQTYDVTDAVRGGSGDALALTAHVGNGWYRGDFGFAGADANYGDEIGLLAALHVAYADGSSQVVPTSPAWTATTSDVVEHSIYHGQRIDARLRGVRGPELTVREGTFDHSRLVAQVAEPVRRHEVLAPQRIWTSPSGKTLVDFGQNLVGWVRVRASGPAGTEITLRHAEVLENDELGTRPLRSARATDTFVLSGEGTDVFEPTFTFHGFRYAEVSGWPGELRPADLEAVVVHSAIRPTSTFECSEPLVNQLVHNSVWGQKGNFLAVPTDCPQRDERLGWTGDIAAYAATAAFQFDVADFLHNWLLDLAEEAGHHEHGWVPMIVPDVLKPTLTAHRRPTDWEIKATAIWGDAAAWVPEALWHAYGDRDRLAAHYPGMVGHVESVIPLLSPSGLWDTGFQFADWLDPDAPPDDPAAAKADKGVVATASFYRSVAFTAETARLLGHDEDAARFEELAQRLRSAFREHYVADRRITSDCATVYSLAICFGLLEGEELAWAADRLAELVRERDYRVTTGFAGTPFVTWALSEHGHADVAYRLLLERECPSWLYPITMGATTIWERWDSMLPDGRINSGEMTSFNHYALGAVADWIYQVVAGIRPAEPGYRRVRVQPVPGEGIDWVRATYESRVGPIAVEWRTAEGAFTLDVTIPDGVPADVVLPDGTTHEVTGGTHTFTA